MPAYGDTRETQRGQQYYGQAGAALPWEPNSTFVNDAWVYHTPSDREGPGGGGGAGGGSGGAGGNLESSLDELGEFGSGMLDPGSEYQDRLGEEWRGQIGKQAGAAERAAALRGAQSGFGGGASPEVLETQGNIARAGLEAAGEVAPGLALRAPQMGMEAISSTFGPRLGIDQLTEQGREFDVGTAEGARKFDVGMEEGGRQFDIGAGQFQQEAAGQRAYQEAQFEQERERMRHQEMLNQMAMGYGGGGYEDDAYAPARSTSPSVGGVGLGRGLV